MSGQWSWMSPQFLSRVEGSWSLALQRGDPGCSSPALPGSAGERCWECSLGGMSKLRWRQEQLEAVCQKRQECLSAPCPAVFAVASLPVTPVQGCSLNPSVGLPAHSAGAALCPQTLHDPLWPCALPALTQAREHGYLSLDFSISLCHWWDWQGHSHV